MADLVSQLAAQGPSLPPEERVRFLDLLLESLHEKPTAGVEDAWDAEIERCYRRCKSASIRWRGRGFLRVPGVSRV